MVGAGEAVGDGLGAGVAGDTDRVGSGVGAATGGVTEDAAMMDGAGVAVGPLSARAMNAATISTAAIRPPSTPARMGARIDAECMPPRAGTNASSFPSRWPSGSALARR